MLCSGKLGTVIVRLLVFQRGKRYRFTRFIGVVGWQNIDLPDIAKATEELVCGRRNLILRANFNGQHRWKLQQSFFVWT
jgi:hypothetical protein